jgi:hypothetical protein
LIVPVCLFVLAQCGLEYVPYLTPPRSLTSLTFFRVQKPAANDSEFVAGEWEYQGIELYYKFYVPGIEVPPISDKSYTKLGELQANGFYRLSSHPDETKNSVLKPVLAIDTGVWDANRDFTIDLSSNRNIKEESTDTVVVAEIRRGVLYGSEELGDPYFRPFLWDDLNATIQRGFASTHADVGEELYNYMDTNNLSKITMAMYALSYGKIDGLLDLHSDAVYLGDISVNFGW